MKFRGYYLFSLVALHAYSHLQGMEFKNKDTDQKKLQFAFTKYIDLHANNILEIIQGFCSINIQESSIRMATTDNWNTHDTTINPLTYTCTLNAEGQDLAILAYNLYNAGYQKALETMKQTSQLDESSKKLIGQATTSAKTTIFKKEVGYVALGTTIGFIIGAVLMYTLKR